MISLVARDALSEQVVCLNASARAGDLARRPNRGVVCAVFDGSDPAAAESFLGLVPGYLIARNPEMSFGELLEEEEPEPVAASLSLPETLKRMRVAQTDALAVVDDTSRFLGVVTQGSIIGALLRREQELLKKSREFRNAVQEDKKRRYETVRRLEQMNHAFRKVLALVARPPGRELFAQGVEALALAVRSSYAAIHLPESGAANHERIAAGTPPGPADDPAAFFAQRWPLVESVIRENKIVTVTDMAARLRRAGAAGGETPPRRATFSNFLGVPISRERQVFGCLYFCDKIGEPFSDDDEALVSSFAQSLGLVMAQARESARRKRAERERDLMSRLALELSGADTLEEVAAIVCSISEEIWQWDSFALSVRRSGRTRFQAVLEIDRTPANGFEHLPPHEPSAPYEAAPPPAVIRDRQEFNARLLSGEALLINRDPDHPGPDLDYFGSERHSNSMIFAPVRVKGEVQGILTVQSYQTALLKESDRELLQKMADAVGPAIKRCQAERVGRALSSLGLALSTAVDPKQVARIIVETADSLLGWDACYVYLYDAGLTESENLIHMDLINGQRVSVESDKTVMSPSYMVRLAIEKGAQLFLRDEPVFEAEAKPFGDVTRPSMSLMIVQLRTAQRVTGLLSIQSYTPRAYDERDLALLQDLADHCSGGLERTRLQRLSSGG